jgi:hypothetical protein
MKLTYRLSQGGDVDDDGAGLAAKDMLPETRVQGGVSAWIVRGGGVRLDREGLLLLVLVLLLRHSV